VFDLGIEGGTVVTPRGRSRAHVYVEGERVAALTGDPQAARRRVDATGLLVMPGMIDTHVHLMDPGATHREDFPTGTAAAARAGVTTIVEHTHSHPVRTADDLAEKAAYLRSRSRVDFGLAAHGWPDRVDEVGPAWQAGATFFKVFTCTTHGVPGFDTHALWRMLTQVAVLQAICLVHCEDEALTTGMERILVAAGRTDPAVLPLWRSREAELVAVVIVTLLARLAGARIVVAHASSDEVVRAAHRERVAGAPVRIESCPQYLTLREEEVLDRGPFRKFTPPARARSEADLTAMWDQLAHGRIDHVSSDHAPSTVQQKREGSIWDAPFGLPGLDTTLPVLLDSAHRGRISYERVVGAYSEAPARTYGLAPRKGSLEPGADADLVLVDPAAEWTAADDDIVSKAGWTPYAGRTLVGRAVQTYLRGALIAEEGRVVAEPGRGRFLAGPGAARGW
jgi:allantoinase